MILQDNTLCCYPPKLEAHVLRSATAPDVELPESLIAAVRATVVATDKQLVLDPHYFTSVSALGM